MPKKRSRFGIKFFTLCDATGYVYNTEVYTGKKNYQSSDVKELGKSGVITMKMVKPILNAGHHLYIDNWYTGFNLAIELRKQKTAMCGTIRRDRGKFPKTFKRKKLEKGETLHIVKQSTLAIRYKDKKDVYFLSTIHRPKLVATQRLDRDGNVILKQELINDYNQNMGFVDKNDAVTKQHTFLRKSHKWTIKVALHLIQEAMFNAHVLYQLAQDEKEPSLRKKLTFTEFKTEYVRQVLSRHSNYQSTVMAKKINVNIILCMFL